MATSPASDVVPLRKTTKRRLADAKVGASYDDLIATLLDITPPEELKRGVERRRGAAARAAEVRALMDERIRRGLERSPEKQLLIASLARERWSLWAREGRVKTLGPRVVAWYPPPEREARRMDVAWTGRRGFVDGESA